MSTRIRNGVVAALIGGLCFSVTLDAALAAGALAIDSRHGSAYGFSHGYDDQDEADREALDQCPGPCRVVLRFQGCGAYAVDRDGSAYGWGVGGARRQAERIAMGECEDHGGESCVIRVWSCD